MFDLYQHSGDSFEMVILGDFKSVYSLSRSPDLRNWTPITNLSSGNGVLYSRDAAPGVLRQFYRVIR